MADEIEVHEKLDTGLNADAVEFCPYEDFQALVLCGTYKLQEETNSQCINYESNQSDSPSNPQTRQGGVSVFRVYNTEKKLHFCLKSRLDLCGVLDIKWPGVPIQDKHFFGLVDSEGFFQTFHLVSEKHTPILVAKHALSESSLGLSLGWDGGIDRPCSKAVCSDSAGCISIFNMDNTSPSLTNRWRAHGYEAWIAAFHDFDSNIVYSGGDDCLLKGWDLRDTCRPAFTSKRHNMGVCSIQSNPFDENIYATGSYDEQLLIWDRRQQKAPLCDVELGGGVWRIKWDPFSGSHILTATMYNGTHILRADYSGSQTVSILSEYKDHNLAYGADWCRLDKDLAKIDVSVSTESKYPSSHLVSTCSFYDHSLHLWEWKRSNIG